MPKPRMKDRTETIDAAVEGRKPNYDDDFDAEVKISELQKKYDEVIKKYVETKDRDFYKQSVEIKKQIDKLKKK